MAAPCPSFLVPELLLSSAVAGIESAQGTSWKSCSANASRCRWFQSRPTKPIQPLLQLRRSLRFPRYRSKERAAVEIFWYSRFYLGTVSSPSDPIGHDDAPLAHRRSEKGWSSPAPSGLHLCVEVHP